MPITNDWIFYKIMTYIAVFIITTLNHYFAASKQVKYDIQLILFIRRHQTAANDVSISNDYFTRSEKRTANVITVP